LNQFLKAKNWNKYLSPDNERTLAGVPGSGHNQELYQKTSLFKYKFLRLLLTE